MSTGSDKAATSDGAVRYRRRMHDGPLTEAAPEDAPQNSHEKRPAFLRRWESPRFVAFTALGIAVLAVVGAVAAWLLPPPEHFSGQESAQAKTKVCTTFGTVRNAVSKGTPNPRPDDPVAQTAVAANVRLAMIGGASFLRETVAAEPAAPADLTNAVTSMATTLDQLGFAYLLMADEATKKPLLQALNSEIVKLNQVCFPKKK